MAMNRAQMFKQVRGYQIGGGINSLFPPQAQTLEEMLGLKSPFAPGQVSPVQRSDFDMLAQGAMAPDTYGQVTLPTLDASLDPVYPGLREALTPPESSPVAALAEAGGAPDAAMDLSPYDSQIEQIKNLLGADKTYEERLSGYQERLAGLVPPQERPNIYDIAGDLARGMAAQDPTIGAARALGAGFLNVSDQLRAERRERQKQKQALAMKAAELAMQDERTAQEFLTKYSIELLRDQGPGEVKPIRLEYDEVDEAGNPTGRRVTRTFDKVTDSAEIREILRTRNGMQKSIEELPPAAPGPETEIDKQRAKALSNRMTELATNADLASAALDNIQQGMILAERIGPENFGKGQEATMGLRQLAASFAPGFVDTKALSAQEALQQITVAFTLANTAKTKGAISDSEMRLFREASPYLGQTYEGFMMALDLQRRAAEKVLQFNREYNDYMEDYLDSFMEQNGRQPSGVELDRAMARWEQRWKDEGQDLFLTDDDKERLRSFEDRGRAAGVTGNFETFNDRWTRIQRERADRAEAKTDQALDEAMMTPEQMIRAIENDQDLSPEDRARLIARIRAGQ